MPAALGSNAEGVEQGALLPTGSQAGPAATAAPQRHRQRHRAAHATGACDAGSFAGIQTATTKRNKKATKRPGLTRTTLILQLQLAQLLQQGADGGQLARQGVTVVVGHCATNTTKAWPLTNTAKARAPGHDASMAR